LFDVTNRLWLSCPNGGFVALATKATVVVVVVVVVVVGVDREK